MQWAQHTAATSRGMSMKGRPSDGASLQGASGGSLLSEDLIVGEGAHACSTG